MLTYSEQLLLLMVDPVSGRLFPVREQVFHLTLAGALLFDASFGGLINDDCENLTVLKNPGNDRAVLGEALRCLEILNHPVPLGQAMILVAAHGKTLRHMLWDSMLGCGMVVTQKKENILSARNRDRFTPDLPMVVEVHKKIREAVFQQVIPDFQVPALISLMEGAGLTKYVLKSHEIAAFRERISWMAGIESLGREILRSIRSLESSDIEQDAASIIGLNPDGPKTFAGGVDSVLSSLSFLYREAGLLRSRKIIASMNQDGGFECPGCAWPNPDGNRSHFEFCESGAKSISSEATTKLCSPAFFKKWSVGDLLLTSDYWLGQQGRLTHPMLLDENATHYKPVSWSDAFRVLADELNLLGDPDEAVFYASGRTSVEAAFLYQLLARVFGTNNLPSSANLCHEPSGLALYQSLGFGKSSVTLDDFPKSEAIFIFGHNPGSNHPRMMKSLLEAARNGCRIVAVNPMPEASLMGFADPQEAASYLGRQTSLTQLFLQPLINGDMALVRGMVKATLEEEDRTGGILDLDFIRNHSSGFDSYRQMVRNTPWETLVKASGVDQAQMAEAAGIYYQAESVIACWCLGITHHRNATATIREIINLLLLRGNIGKPGAGVCPVRGQSNIQGIRTAGVGANMPVAFLESMERRFSTEMPRKPGLSVIPAIKSLAGGKAKVLISLGGNLASAVPDSDFTEQALRRTRLTVMISTTLNRSHLITGKRALILPCLSRSEEDVVNGVKQMVSIEDTMGKIGFSAGCLAPASPHLMSETAIISTMAMGIDRHKHITEWEKFVYDCQYIRSVISQTIPAFSELAARALEKESFYLDNPLRHRVFKTPEARAQFSVHPLEWEVAEARQLMLMTIRSHDQFNTSIFGLNDRYRGIVNERRVLFMNPDDMKTRGIAPEQIVSIISDYDDRQRKLTGYYAIPYPVRQGCVAAYFPETNVLLSINNTSADCETPAYKSIKVTVTKDE